MFFTRILHVLKFHIVIQLLSTLFLGAKNHTEVLNGIPVSSLPHVNYGYLLNVLILVRVITLNIIVAFQPQVKVIYTKLIEYLRIKI